MIQNKAGVEDFAVVEEIPRRYRFKSDYEGGLFQSFSMFMEKGKTIDFIVNEDTNVE